MGCAHCRASLQKRKEKIILTAIYTVPLTFSISTTGGQARRASGLTLTLVNGSKTVNGVNTPTLRQLLLSSGVWAPRAFGSPHALLLLIVKAP